MKSEVMDGKFDICLIWWPNVASGNTFITLNTFTHIIFYFAIAKFYFFYLLLVLGIFCFFLLGWFAALFVFICVVFGFDFLLFLGYFATIFGFDFWHFFKIFFADCRLILIAFFGFDLLIFFCFWVWLQRLLIVVVFGWICCYFWVWFEWLKDGTIGGMILLGIERFDLSNFAKFNIIFVIIMILFFSF